MKYLVILILSTIYTLASTQYKTPVFVVEKSTLYCVYYSYENSKLIEYLPGDLVAGDTAASNCSYNYDTANKQLTTYLAKFNITEPSTKPTTTFLNIIIGVVLLLGVASITMLAATL